MLSLALIFLSGIFAAVSPRRTGPLSVVVAVGAAHFHTSMEALFALFGLLLIGHLFASILSDET
jgi:hypothetical protein